MKSILYVVTLLLGISSTMAQSQTVRLYGSLKDLKLQEVILKYDGATAFISDKGDVVIPVNSDGTFNIEFPIEKPGYYSIRRNPLYLTPGDEMKIDIKEIPELSTFEGKGAEVNRYLSTRFYPKGGSYLNAGKYSFPDFNKTKRAIDSIMTKRRAELVALKCTPEFRELEEVRIKADMLQSIYYYPAYNGRNMFPANCTKEEATKIRSDFFQGQKEVVEPVLRELASSDAYVDIEVVRYALLLYSDLKLFDFKLSDRLEELQEAYYTAAKLNNKEITPVLYKEVNDYISTMKYGDFREALSFRLERRAKLMEGRPAPDIELSDIQGNKTKLSDYKGNVLYVDFWATWCAPCRAETPFFNALSEKYPNIRFIAVSIDEKRALWENEVKGGNHGRVIELLSDDNELRAKWDVIGIPRFLLIDENFNIINSSAPRPSEKASIEPLLEKYSH